MSEDSNPNPSASPRILILGVAGQLGRELERAFAGFGSVLAPGRESADLALPDQLRALVRRVQPNVILNAAAYTAVDRAESEPALAHAINAHAPRVLAEEALRCGALLVHYSTDYVFDGRRPEPWTEADAPHPLNVYGASKLAGEQAIAAAGGQYLIFRTSWVYGPHGHNFLLTMLRLARERASLSIPSLSIPSLSIPSLSIVDDQIGAPTNSIQLARATRTIVAGVLAGRFGVPQEWSGLYHMTCAGAVSWFGFAQAIFARASALLAVNPPQLVPIATEDYPTPAARPRNSVLSNAKLHARFAVQLPPWQSALEETLQALRESA